MKYQTTRRERIAYPLFSFGQNMVFVFVSYYLSLYFTDHLFIPAVTVSAIFLVAKVWDAVNDPLFGIIVDRVQFKSGKFKPWLRVSTIAIPLTTALLFSLVPGLPLGWRVALAMGSYFLWDFAYTIGDVPVFSLLTTMTGDVQERSTLASRGSIAGVVCTIVVIVGLGPQLDSVGFAPIGWVVAAFAFAGMLPLTLVAKERNRPAPKQKEEAYRLRDIFAYLKGNKYLFLFYASSIINGVLAISLTLNSYIMIYFFGGLDFLALLTAIGVVPLLIVYLLMPRLTARFDRMLLYRIIVIAGMAMNVIIYFVGPGNRALFGTLSILKTVIATPAGLLALTFTMDCVEYGHYATGQRREGITFAVQTFSNKLSQALAASLALLILGLIGYNGMLDVQNPATMAGMWAVSYWVPILGTLLSLPPLFMYKLKSRDVQVMSDINAGKIPRDEGERLLSRKY